MELVVVWGGRFQLVDNRFHQQRKRSGFVRSRGSKTGIDQ